MIVTAWTALSKWGTQVGRRHPLIRVFFSSFAARTGVPQGRENKTNVDFQRNLAAPCEG